MRAVDPGCNERDRVRCSMWGGRIVTGGDEIAPCDVRARGIDVERAAVQHDRTRRIRDRNTAHGRVMQRQVLRLDRYAVRRDRKRGCAVEATMRGNTAKKRL